MADTYKDANKPIEQRVEDLLSKMTIEEKIAQINSVWVYELLDQSAFSETKAHHLLKNGIGQITRVGGASSLDPVDTAKLANQIQKLLAENTRLGIPAMVHEESCSGYMAKGATVFPQTIGVASTWNDEAVKELGAVIRKQMKAVGAQQALAPLLDVTRDARWGRTEETFGEDPYLISHMGVSYVQGLQTDQVEKGVIATGKHFVGYGEAEGGMNWAPPHIPMRELHDVFLLPFEAAVKEAHLGSIMPGYHEMDGIPCHRSSHLLNTILREQWEFDGLIVSDYFAVNMLKEYHKLARDKEQAAELALKAGVDVELPSIDCYGEPLKAAIEKGAIGSDLVDTAVKRVLTAKFRMGLFENPYVDVDRVPEFFNQPEQRNLARQMARESMVLLKNEKDTLPLKKNAGTIAVIGPNADNIRHLVGDYAYPSHVESLIEMRDQDNVFDTPVPEGMEKDENAVSMTSILEAIKSTVESGTQVIYAKGADVTGEDTGGIEEAVEAAKQADISIVVVGGKSGLIDNCTSGESRDRAELTLPGVQEQLVKAVYEQAKQMVVVLVNGRPLSMNWTAKHVPAIIEAWLPGEEGATALAEVLFGDYNPGGRLPISIPRSVGQVPVYYYHKPSGGRSHWKGDYVEMSPKPLYPFGFGLSYTKFKYSDMTLSDKSVPAGSEVTVQVNVENIGSRAGDEVIQLYIHDSEASVTRPVKELKGFKRVSLQPGEKKRVAFHLSTTQLGFYNEDFKYVVEPGEVEVMIGSSSEDIHLQDRFEINGETLEVEDRAFITHVDG